MELDHDSYVMFWWMVVLSILINYFIMSNVMLTFTNGVYNYLTKLYMALLMGALMAIVMIVIMMVQARMITSLSLAILVSALFIAVVLIILIREQAFIYQADFSRSMIEHHDMAILMSEQILQKPDQSPAVYDLAHTIIASQQAEIDLMHSWLTNGFPP
jgi:hypothetical protein